MAANLNPKAVTHARKLSESGKVERDVRDDWSEHAPTADDENAYIDKHGFAAFRRMASGPGRGTIRRHEGQRELSFRRLQKIHRCAPLSLEAGPRSTGTMTSGMLPKNCWS